jgi:hypothetical protein
LGVDPSGYLHAQPSERRIWDDVLAEAVAKREILDEHLAIRIVNAIAKGLGGK